MVSLRWANPSLNSFHQILSACLLKGAQLVRIHTVTKMSRVPPNTNLYLHIFEQIRVNNLVPASRATASRAANVDGHSSKMWAGEDE